MKAVSPSITPRPLRGTRRRLVPRLPLVWRADNSAAELPTEVAKIVGWERLEPFVFYGAVLLLLIPLWKTHHFPSQDGPLHLYNSIVLRDYNRPDRTAFREFFVPNSHIVPNYICPHLLPVLVKWLSPEMVEKFLLSAYLIMFPLSVRYCLGGINRHAVRLSIAALPFVPNQFYHMGFEDFCLSLVGFFVASGYYIRRRERFGWLNACVLGVVFLCVYLTVDRASGNL